MIRTEGNDMNISYHAKAYFLKEQAMKQSIILRINDLYFILPVFDKIMPIIFISLTSLLAFKGNKE